MADKNTKRRGGRGSVSRRNRRTWVAIAVFVGIAALSGLVGYGLYRGLPSGTRTAPASATRAAAIQGPMVRIGGARRESPRVNLGDVPMVGTRAITATFEVISTLDRPVTVVYMETSCDCTLASLTIDGRSGPIFSMRHDTPPGLYEWQGVVHPDDPATLTVSYNPQAHGVLTPEEAPELHGPATRIVRLHLDTGDFMDVRIDLNQQH